MKFGSHTPQSEKPRGAQSPMAVFTGGLQVSGTQWKFTFPNGYGASVIDDGYGAEMGQYELAVLDSADRLAYDTPVTNDVLGWLTEAEVAEALDKIAALPDPTPSSGSDSDTPVTYTGTLNYHGLDLMLDVHTDGTHEIRCRPVLRNEWTTWSAPVTLVADPAGGAE